MLRGYPIRTKLVVGRLQDALFGCAAPEGDSVRIPSGFRVSPVLLAALLLILAAGSSPAADFPPGSTPAATDNVAGPVAPAADNTDNVTGPEAPAADNTDNVAGPEAPAADNGWVDRTHSQIERDLFDTAVWFDRFFGDDRMVVPERPEWYLRWKNELRWDQEEHYTFRSTVRASLRLPRLKDRWHLMVSSESRGDPNAIIREDPGNPALDIGSRGRVSSTELVYDIFRTPNSVLDVGAGVRVKIPPDAFVRTRFQHARPVAFNTHGRFTATAYWDALDGLGETNQLDLERWLAPPTLLRWSNSITITEISRWWTWGTELSLLRKLSPKSAFTFAVGASGSTHPSWVATNYRILARYRRNVWRKWLFLEGEPDIHWPKKGDGSRRTVWGATLRVEIVFAGVERNPPAGEGGKP